MTASNDTFSGSGRFAPSPTGALHIGNLRTAVAAWLRARGTHARFLVRIDDLDPDRSKTHWVQHQLGALTAIGIDWDAEPVRQSDRRAEHDRAIDTLIASDLAYPCFCTRAQLKNAALAPHGSHDDEPRYAGTCARLAPSQAAARVAAGEEHALRLRALGTTVRFNDAVFGRVEREVDDFIIRRKDGVPAYNLAAMVDDVAQGVTEVVRGADLLHTTPRQLLVAQLLNLHAPTYAHVPLVVGPDGERLAKRHGAVTLDALHEHGVGIEAVRQWIVESLGQPPNAQSLELTLLPREPAIFSVASLQG